MSKNIIHSLWKELVALAISGITIIIFIVPWVFNESTVKEATLVAKNTAQQYSLLRSYYTKNVIGKLTKSTEISAASNYHNQENTIPLPATMIHELGELSKTTGLQIKLYSAFPFPDRSARTLDTFQQQAWNKLNDNPNQPYIASQTINGIHLVRVAIADLLTEQACVDCHNSHPQTPKVGWQLGDVRGVLEVVVPIEQQITWQHDDSIELSVIFIILFLIIFYVILRIINKESRSRINDTLVPLKNQKRAMNAHSLLSEADKNGNITYVNDKFVKVSGYTKAELIGRKHSMLNSNNRSKAYWKSMHDTVLAGNTWHDEVRNRAKDGHFYWVDTTIVPNFDSDNNIIGFTSIRTDITEQIENIDNLAIAKKQAEAANFALDQHSLVSIATLDGTMTYVNEKFVEISGFEEHELLGQKHNLLNSNNQPKSYWQQMHQTVIAGRVWHDEVRNRAKAGHYYWVDTTIVPNYDKNQNVIGFTSIRTDITEQKENVDNLAIAKEQAEAANFALDQHSLVSIAKLDGTILYVNEKFVEVSGYQQHELLGKKHSLLNSNNQTKSYWHDMHHTILAGHVWHDEVRNRAKNGHYYWVDTTIVPNYDKNKKVIGFTSIRTDITQQKDNLANLAIAKEQAEVASNSKADFLANMSHEIRTPMNGVIGMTNLLLDSDLNTEQNKLANTVKSSAVGLLGIINDILDFSKVEAGKLDLELIPFNLGQMVGDTGTTMSYQAHQKGLHLICPATPIFHQWVNADPGRIRQILTNLIGNAIKFTEQGEVAVYVHLVEEMEDKKRYRFEVKDTGIGISKFQQIKLFEKFSQADNSTTRKYGGTGLGLSISKKLVELMGGSIGIESELGHGATFWFELPLQSTQAIGETPVYNTDIKHERVLIVDDNETNLELMHQLHKAWGIPHQLVNCPKKALLELELAEKHGSPYSIAILDMHMPEIDGLELCRQIQRSPSLRQTKLIMASSHAQRGDASKMKTAGFQGYLTKPIQQSELFDVLLMVSGLQQADVGFITRHSTSQHAMFKAHVLVVEDNPTNQLVIEGLLRTLGITVDLAANGAEAISALQGMSNHDLVFMDCQMPILDGYQATKIIRSEGTGITHRDVPIIAMTANAMAGDKEKCLASGMDDYLSKPIEPKSVISMLKQWLPHSVQKNSQPAKPVINQSKNIAIKSDKQVVIFDYEDMATRLMNDPELMNAVADVFFQDLVEQIDELKVSIAEKDVIAAAATIHKIKGASANVGGKALSELALKMEMAGKAGDLGAIADNIDQLELNFQLLKDAIEQAL